jgi:hypothetical protein
VNVPFVRRRTLQNAQRRRRGALQKMLSPGDSFAMNASRSRRGARLQTVVPSAGRQLDALCGGKRPRCSRQFTRREAVGF